MENDKIEIAPQTKLAALSYAMLLLVMIITSNMAGSLNDYSLNILLLFSDKFELVDFNTRGVKLPLKSPVQFAYRSKLFTFPPT